MGAVANRQQPLSSTACPTAAAPAPRRAAASRPLAPRPRSTAVRGRLTHGPRKPMVSMAFQPDAARIVNIAAAIALAAGAAPLAKAAGTAATRRLFPCLAHDLPMSAVERKEAEATKRELAAAKQEAEATKQKLAAVEQELAELKAWKAAFCAKEMKQAE